MHKYAVNNELNVLCEYELIPQHSNSQVLTIDNDESKYQVNLINSLLKQWEKQNKDDLMLIASCNRVLYANTFILKARSPVFERMLESNMQEVKNNYVKIRDLNYDTLSKMVRFMHSGKVDVIDRKSVSDLLYAAEKYDIKDLKEACGKFLFKNLRISNASKALELCEIYGLRDVKPHVEAFVKANKRSI